MRWRIVSLRPTPAPCGMGAQGQERARDGGGQTPSPPLTDTQPIAL